MFERHFGTAGLPEQQAEVSKRCVAAEPHHGERWSRAAKGVKSAHAPAHGGAGHWHAAAAVSRRACSSINCDGHGYVDQSRSFAQLCRWRCTT